MPGGRPPITAAQHADVVRMLGEDLARNEICRRTGLSGHIVSKIAREQGHSFSTRKSTAEATAARKIDLAARRAELEAGLLDDAHRLRGQLFAKTTYIDHGGKDFTRAEWTQDQPHHADKLKLMQAISSAVSSALKIAEHDVSDGAETEKSLLASLGRALGVTGPDA
jgi:hypothetical protein